LRTEAPNAPKRFAVSRSEGRDWSQRRRPGQGPHPGRRRRRQTAAGTGPISLGERESGICSRRAIPVGRNREVPPSVTGARTSSPLCRGDTTSPRSAHIAPAATTSGHASASAITGAWDVSIAALEDECYNQSNACHAPQAGAGWLKTWVGLHLARGAPPTLFHSRDPNDHQRSASSPLSLTVSPRCS
jgi:hypothetical protein